MLCHLVRNRASFGFLGNEKMSQSENVELHFPEEMVKGSS